MGRPATSKTRLTLVAAFVLALGGGVVLGLAAGRRPASPVVAPPATQPGEHSWLADQLNLTPDQRERMKDIWSALLQGPAQTNRDRRRQVEKDRDDALLALLTPEQRAEYDRRMAGYAAQLADLGKERERLFHDAVEQTKLILNDSQRQRYDELLKAHDAERANRGHRHNPGGSPAGTDPRTRPATGPAVGPAAAPVTAPAAVPAG